MFIKNATIIVCSVFLFACGDKGEPPAEPVSESQAIAGEDNSTDEAAIEYQKKVKKKVSNSVTSSLAREWGVSEDKVRCVMGQLKISEIQQANTDPAARAVFEECGVDPAVVD